MDVESQMEIDTNVKCGIFNIVFSYEWRNEIPSYMSRAGLKVKVYKMS